MTVSWNEENAAHLLRRAGFGGTAAKVESWGAKGLEKTLKGVLKTAGKSSPFDINGKTIHDLHADWVRLMVTTNRPLVEKMVLFWHDYFATANNKVASVKFMARQNKKFRDAGMGKFRALLRKVSKDPAMIHWLDNQSNVKEAPNENFARELLELFTLGAVDKEGAPNYTEKDVSEVARAFTGWHEARGKFKFATKDHDFGPKTILGVQGAFDGLDVIDLLVEHPATRRRVCAKLFQFFAYDVALDDPVLDPLIDAWKATDGNIVDVLGVLFRLDAFYSDVAKYSRVKSPAEFLVGTMRMLDGKLSSKSKINYGIAFSMASMGQTLFDPPSVAGWEGGAAWTSTNGMLARTRGAELIADSRKELDPAFKWKAKSLLGPKSTWGAMSADDVVTKVLTALGPVEVTSATRKDLVDYLELTPSGMKVPFVLDDLTFDTKVRGLLFLVLSSPYYQLA